MAKTDDSVKRLRDKGYALLPIPMSLDLDNVSTILGSSNELELDAVPANDKAVVCLMNWIKQHCDDDRYHMKIRFVLLDKPLPIPYDDGRADQAYSLEIEHEAIIIKANQPAGLFYGVQTLIQLLESREGKTVGWFPIPRLKILDWPRYELRALHWDSKKHQDRLKTLKRYLDWAARFKFNAVIFEFEDKFEYPSFPIIGVPGAFTKEQIQELTRYALERHIQLIPDVQAPAHMSYVLKHEQFAHLRCDGSNYQICMDNPEARRMVFQMYRDACEATPGVDYFLASTDEAYYATICEKYRKPFSEENASLTFMDFVQAAHEELRLLGRKMIIWFEEPLLPEHVKLLPNDIIDSNYQMSKEYCLRQAEIMHGIHPLLCVSAGGHPLFPEYYRENKEDKFAGLLSNGVEWLQHHSDWQESYAGTIIATWDDCGLHNETFWLLWACMGQFSWSPDASTLDSTIQDFIDIYYGRDTLDLPEVYEILSEQSGFWWSSWDVIWSKMRRKLYGVSSGKRPFFAKDRTLTPPPLPYSPDLLYEPVFEETYKDIIEKLPGEVAKNVRLRELIEVNHAKAVKNKYNLEVFMTVAQLLGHHLHMLGSLTAAERLLVKASASAVKEPELAVAMMGSALGLVKDTILDLHRVFSDIGYVWEQSQYPRNADFGHNPSNFHLGGKMYLHVLDDVKDFFADRTKDLSYLILPERSMALDRWCDKLEDIIVSFAEFNNVEPWKGG